MTERIVRIPKAVRVAVGRALTERNLQKWWKTKHALLGGLSPNQVWKHGNKQNVLNFINAAKSGDMA